MCHKYILLICVLMPVSGMIHAVEQNKPPHLYDNYAIALKNYVNDKGMVNYKKLKAQPQELEKFITAIGGLEPNDYNGWNDNEKIALWLNAYNAFTLKAIIDNYPIKSGFFRSMYYPKNSIRQITGVWDKMTFKVMGKDYTLEQIEHKILRKKFNEPRIHMALVCAAIGCPPLCSEPYIGEKLDSQLDDQSRKFLADSEKYRFSKTSIHLSPIFKWFADDFAKAYGTEERFAGYDGQKAAILKFIVKYLEEDDKKWLKYKIRQKVKYLKYDWSLNEQK